MLLDGPDKYQTLALVYVCHPLSSWENHVNSYASHEVRTMIWTYEEVHYHLEHVSVQGNLDLPSLTFSGQFHSAFELL